MFYTSKWMKIKKQWRLKCHFDYSFNLSNKFVIFLWRYTTNRIMATEKRPFKVNGLGWTTQILIALLLKSNLFFICWRCPHQNHLWIRLKIPYTSFYLNSRSVRAMASIKKTSIETSCSRSCRVTSNDFQMNHDIWDTLTNLRV